MATINTRPAAAFITSCRSLQNLSGYRLPAPLTVRALLHTFTVLFVSG